MSRGTILVTWPYFDPEDPDTGKRLVDAGYALRLEPKVGGRTPAALAALLADAVAAIVSTDPFTAEVLEAHPGLRVIARVGVGIDSIDRDAADRNGVAIAITPGLNAETVADHTIAMILASLRRTVEQDAIVKAGRWDRLGPHTPGELSGRTVGIVGAGSIGQAVIRRLRGFDVTILFHDSVVTSIEGAAPVASLDALLEVADIVSLHAPLTLATRGMIDARAIARMKPDAILVNTARGPLVDQAALFAALRQGQLAGAALDVFTEEPPHAAALEDIPNLLCSAHLAGLSRESVRRMTCCATSSVLDVLGGRLPMTIINREAICHSIYR